MGHPKPTALRIKQGNLAKRALNAHEPQPTVEIPDVPAFVRENVYALAEWDYITPRLQELGILTSLDRAAISAYCMAYARWSQAEERAAGQAMVVKSSTGSPMMNPLIRASRDAMTQMTEICKEFGMTPSSRTRLHVDPDGILRLSQERGKYFA